MKKKIVVQSSLFPAGKQKIFHLLQKLETLQYVAAPYATFLPIDKKQSLVWEENSVFSFRFYLFEIISFGTHTVHVLSFNETSGIYTHETNKHVPVWNHRISLEKIDDHTTRYTDEVEIRAGWKTPLVALWAKAFYRHRQRKWLKLLLAKAS